MVYRKALGDHAAHRMAGNDGCSEMERVHERCQVCREIIETIACHRTTRIAVAPLCQGKGADGLGQVRQHALEGVPGVSDAMQQQQGCA